jgi:hypothetical protein
MPMHQKMKGVQSHLIKWYRMQAKLTTIKGFQRGTYVHTKPFESVRGNISEADQKHMDGREPDLLEYPVVIQITAKTTKSKCLWYVLSVADPRRHPVSPIFTSRKACEAWSKDNSVRLGDAFVMATADNLLN